MKTIELSTTDRARPVTTPDDLVWGADAIAKAIGRPLRVTQHLLEKKLIRGAKKVGGRWVGNRRKMLADLGGDDIA